jgi:outer membrane lipoprotein LolB
VRWAAVFAVAGLAACATLEPAPTAQPPAFEFGGRLAVRSSTQAFSSMVRWTQQQGRDEIWLSTPLGQSVAHLTADRTGATLTGAEGKQYRAASVESLTQSALGWRLPLAPLRYWLRGTPAPWLPQSAAVYDTQQRLMELTQAEWHVVWHYADAERTTPVRIEASDGSAALKLVIDHFEELAP